ncbi:MULTISPECIES: ComF family protein [Lactobacillus]|uniref:ComF family protein n=1 Tax=Lactobacillus xujianguonis TaxID=2495899 RepID=A0A437STU5_9LACO|nr:MULTISPECIES: ComF family protein [Lactobacillus]RVU70284.1 ComF family protein [Lactobacillus xujianguonis]RVU73322.1 ComF family protein [Lactobacillus xujianguonis]
MNICLLCQQVFIPELSWIELFSLKKAGQHKFCTQCMKKFEKLTKIRCRYCDKNLSTEGVCRDCQNWTKIYPHKLLKHHALYRYNDSFHDLMVNYKRYGDYALREVLQALCAKELAKLKFDCYIPIPTSPEHQATRQFDTISAIFAELVPLTPLLKKYEKSGAQGEKNKQERLLSPQAFYLETDQHLADNISQGRILLLDDIYTTGRTLYHARDKVLEEFPDAQIESFSICR